MHWAEQGAYTGEIAPGMVAEFCTAVIIGHSERRQFFGETDETVNRKVAGGGPARIAADRLRRREP